MPTVFQQLIQQGKDIGIKEGRDIGIKEGKDIGIKEGEEKSQLKIAVNCLLKGMDVLTISEITNLPIEQIETMHEFFCKTNLTKL